MPFHAFDRFLLSYATCHFHCRRYAILSMLHDFIRLLLYYASLIHYCWYFAIIFIIYDALMLPLLPLIYLLLIILLLRPLFIISYRHCRHYAIAFHWYYRLFRHYWSFTPPPYFTPLLLFFIADIFIYYIPPLPPLPPFSTLLLIHYLRHYYFAEPTPPLRHIGLDFIYATLIIRLTPITADITPYITADTHLLMPLFQILHHAASHYAAPPPYATPLFSPLTRALPICHFAAYDCHTPFRLFAYYTVFTTPHAITLFFAWLIALLHYAIIAIISPLFLTLFIFITPLRALFHAADAITPFSPVSLFSPFSCRSPCHRHHFDIAELPFIEAYVDIIFMSHYFSPPFYGFFGFSCHYFHSPPPRHAVYISYHAAIFISLPLFTPFSLFRYAIDAADARPIAMAIADATLAAVFHFQIFRWAFLLPLRRWLIRHAIQITPFFDAAIAAMPPLRCLLAIFRHVSFVSFLISASARRHCYAIAAIFRYAFDASLSDYFSPLPMHLADIAMPCFRHMMTLLAIVDAARRFADAAHTFH